MMNKNGERLLEFYELLMLVIANTVFPHRDINKTTWTPPSPHRIVKQKQKSNRPRMHKHKFCTLVQDARAYRGADVSSNHTWCIAKLIIKLIRTKN